MTVSRWCVLAVLAGLALSTVHAETAMDRAINAHGGLDTWKQQGTLAYDMQWGPPGNPAKTLNDHQVFDLVNRNGQITADDYTIVGRDGEVWFTGEKANVAGGRPARFYLWTPFYFFAMPFVFADPGVQLESLGTKTFQGKEYDAVKVTYGNGVGDTPDDYYVAYIDPETGRLKLVYYIVTYASLVADLPNRRTPEHAMVFDEWQEVDGLTVPKVGTYYDWVDEDIQGDPLGRMTITNVEFSTERPAPDTFATPEGATLDESHK